MKILIIGNGAREHALTWAISQNPRCTKIYCSPGTYIRSLARDLAHKLGTYGFATDIVRNKNSFFLSDNAIFINKILNTNKENLIKLVLPVDYSLKNYTQINVGKKYSKMIKDGRIINVENLKKVNKNIYL